jgi:signal peptidase II
MSRGVLRFFYLFVAALVILADRLSKAFIRTHIALDVGSVPVIPHFLSITHVENTGAAFSLFAAWPSRVRVPLLVGFSILALIVVGYLLWNTVERFTWSGLALALILGGAIGNLYDRILYGHVTDFVHCYIGAYSWPDFNLADSAIVVGSILLALHLLFGGKGKAAQQH